MVYHLPPGRPRLHLTGPVLARDLPRPDHQLERPGHHRPQPRRVPPARADHRRAPLRRQRHHLHLQQLPVRRRPGLGRQGRHRQDPALAGRGRRRRQRRGGQPRSTAPPFSIGYVEQAYSKGLLLPFAAIRNQAGNYVIPSTQSVAADAAQKPAITPADFSIVNQPGADSYPISGYSWALVYTHQPSQATGQALVTMLDWLTHDGQAYAAATGYVPCQPDPATRPHHAPADHRPCCRPPSQLTSVSRAARCPGQDNLSAPNESQPVSWLGKMRPCRNGRTPCPESDFPAAASYRRIGQGDRVCDAP